MVIGDRGARAGAHACACTAAAISPPVSALSELFDVSKSRHAATHVARQMVTRLEEDVEGYAQSYGASEARRPGSGPALPPSRARPGARPLRSAAGQR